MRAEAVGVDDTALLAEAQKECERLWATVPEWDWKGRAVDEFSPMSFSRLEEDLGNG
jgi:hypothetical protein